MRISEIVSSTEYLTDEQFQNLPIFQFRKLKKFPKFDNSENRRISIIHKFIK